MSALGRAARSSLGLAGRSLLWTILIPGWLERSPATHVQLDLTRRGLRLVRFGLSGRQIRSLSFDELQSVEVDQGTDSDDGTVWRPAVRLRSGELVLLSELWSHDQAGVEEAVAVVAEACRLPRTKPQDAGRIPS